MFSKSSSYQWSEWTWNDKYQRYYRSRIDSQGKVVYDWADPEPATGTGAAGASTAGGHAQTPRKHQASDIEDITEGIGKLSPGSYGENEQDDPQYKTSGKSSKSRDKSSHKSKKDKGSSKDKHRDRGYSDDDEREHEVGGPLSDLASGYDPAQFYNPSTQRWEPQEPAGQSSRSGASGADPRHQDPAYVAAGGSSRHQDPAYVPTSGSSRRQDPAYAPTSGSSRHQDSAYVAAGGSSRHQDPAYVPTSGSSRHQDPVYAPASGSSRHHDAAYVAKSGSSRHHDASYPATGGSHRTSATRLDTSAQNEVYYEHEQDDELMAAVEESRRHHRRDQRAGESSSSPAAAAAAAAAAATAAVAYGISQYGHPSAYETIPAYGYEEDYDDDGPPTPKGRISADDETYDEMDPRYRVEHSQRFMPGEIFKVHWSEPKGASSDQHPSISGREEVRNRFGTKFYVGFRRFIVVANDQGHCTCVPILTYGGKACKKSGVKPNKHGIIYQRGHKARLLDKEPKLGFAPVRVEMQEEGERLSKESRVNYSKLITVEHNVSVFFIGSVVPSDWDIVSEAVNLCWNEKTHHKKKFQK